MAHGAEAKVVVAVAAVGGIAPWCAPGTLALPDDLIDYTSGRDHTYADGGSIRRPNREGGNPVAERAAVLDAGDGTDAHVAVLNDVDPSHTIGTTDPETFTHGKVTKNGIVKLITGIKLKQSTRIICASCVVIQHN